MWPGVRTGWGGGRLPALWTRSESHQPRVSDVQDSCGTRIFSAVCPSQRIAHCLLNCWLTLSFQKNGLQAKLSLNRFTMEPQDQGEN